MASAAIHAVTGVDRDEKLREVLFAPIGTMLGAPDTRTIERDGWYQIVTPSSGSTIGNEVVLSRLTTANAEAVVRATIAEYARARVPFKWCVGPLSEPPELGALLERHGFSVGVGRGMAIEPSQWRAQPTDIEIDEISIETVPSYFDAFELGWGGELVVSDRAAMIAMHQRAVSTGSHRYFIARIDGRPAGTAGVALKPRSGYLIGGNVVPAYRGRGVYRALVGVRLELLAALGIPLATTQARESTSAPLLERMGFETMFQMRVYRLADPADAMRRFDV